MAAHSSVLAWEIHGQRSLAWWATAHGFAKRVRHALVTKQQQHGFLLKYSFDSICSLVYTEGGEAIPVFSCPGEAKITTQSYHCTSSHSH